MKTVLIFGLCSLIVSCIKEQSTNYYTYLKNTTSHKIEVQPFFGGSIRTDKVIILLAGETKQIAIGTDRGIVGNAGFNSQQLSGSDSIVVVFNNLYKITHYFTTPTGFSPKYYVLSSPRNLYNKDNYIYTYQDLSKYQRQSDYNYLFIEQDYLDTR